MTTEYDYGDAILHDPVEEKAFGAQLLSPLYSVSVCHWPDRQHPSGGPGPHEIQEAQKDTL